MALIAIFLDRPTDPANGHRRLRSVLSMPLGAGTVLDYAAALAADIGAADLFILGPTDDRQGDAGAARPSAGGVTERIETLTDVAERYEPSDLLVLIDPRYWPAQPVDVSGFVRVGRDYPGATFAVPVGNDSGRAVERIAFDVKGNISGVRRYYSRAPRNRLATAAIPYATLPVHSVVSRHLSSLSESRRLMASMVLMIQDVPLHSDVLDLSDDCGLLALNERIIADVTGRAPLPSGYSRLAPGVLVGRGTLIHESVRIEPPVVIQHGVIIEEQATIIGPTVISGGATVGRSAIVAQSLLATGTTIAPDVIVRHQVVTEAFEPVPMGARDSGGPMPHDALRPAPSSAVRDPARKRLLYSTLKRAFDFVIAAFALLFLSPLFALVALLIKLDSRGPVFFVHGREGRHGRPFPCVKFRTMHRGAHQMQRKLYAQNLVDGPQFKLRVDPRVTRVGHYLRRTNLDELPQLVNVLVGHVSLVGPRPSPFRENQICVPWRRGRLSVRPGITGLWQICRDQHRECDDFQQWIYYDMEYVRHMSMWLDIKILMGTILTLGGQWRVPLSWMTGSAGTQRAKPKLYTRYHEPPRDVMRTKVYSST